MLCYQALTVKYQVLQKTPLVSHMILITVCITQTILVFTNTLIRRKKFAHFAQTTVRCENAFKEITLVSYQKLNRKIHVHVAVFVIVIAITVAMQICILEGAYEGKLSIYTTIFGFPMVLNGSICLFALSHVLEIRRGFCIVNECLKRMQVTNRWKIFEYKTVLKQKLWKPNTENLALVGKLHLELNNCIKEFNDIFGVLLIVKLVISLVKTLMGLYFAYIGFQHSMHILAVCCAIMALIYSASLIELCQKCSSTISEVNACSVFLHQEEF